MYFAHAAHQFLLNVFANIADFNTHTFFALVEEQNGWLTKGMVSAFWAEKVYGISFLAEKGDLYHSLSIVTKMYRNTQRKLNQLKIILKGKKVLPITGLMK